MKRIALIGFGPHSKRIYYPYLEDLLNLDKNATFELLVELEINRDKINSFFSDKKIKPKKIIFLSTGTQIIPKTIDPQITKLLSQLRINRVIVTTEPKAHKIYLEECVRLGIPTLTDKPITCPINLISSTAAAENIYTDVAELISLTKKSQNSRILVQCQRRNHAGYIKVFKTIEDIITQYQIPITHVSIHHSDGMWNMPDEFFYRENHPYKYGYGKLMHSGYHFIDLLVNILKLNNLITDKKADTMTLFSQYSKASDQAHIINQKDYQNFFGKNIALKFDPFISKKEILNFGEVDSYSQIQLMKDDKILTTAQLSLIQSGFSQRAWAELPQDSYKSNGRIRHEHVNIHIGPLANIQIHSYQSKQISEQSLSKYGVGDNNHFDIYIFRNSNLIGGKSFEKIEYGATDFQKNNSNKYLGHNEYARRKTLDELIYNTDSNSDISSHLSTNKLLSEIYKNHIKQSSGEIPFSKINLNEIL